MLRNYISNSSTSQNWASRSQHRLGVKIRSGKSSEVVPLSEGFSASCSPQYGQLLCGLPAGSLARGRYREEVMALGYSTHMATLTLYWKFIEVYWELPCLTIITGLQQFHTRCKDVNLIVLWNWAHKSCISFWSLEAVCHMTLEE